MGTSILHFSITRIISIFIILGTSLFIKFSWESVDWSNLLLLSIIFFVFQSGQVSSYGLNSRISYSPKTELDYGNLFCWATNSVGRGSPCVFTILPIGPPDPPAKCRTSNVTYSSFEVGWFYFFLIN